MRAVGDLELYERALQDRGLNTLATVGGFWGGQQVGDLLAYLRALANPLDELALYGTLASPLVGVSSDGLALLGRAAKASKRSVWETVRLLVGEDLPAVRLPPEADRPAGEPQSRRSGSSPSADQFALCSGSPPSADRSALRLLPPADRDLLVEFCVRFQTERAAAGRRTLSQLIERALDRSGYVEHVLSLSWPERRLANVHKLLRLARRYEASEGRDLRGFLDHVAHHQDGRSGAEPDAPVADGEADAVRLMSIHAAKGLEFGVVCVADLGRAQNLGVPGSARGRRPGRAAPGAARRIGGDAVLGLERALRGAPAGAGRGGGPDSLRRDDPRARAAAVERGGRPGALAGAAARRPRDLLARPGAVGGTAGERADSCIRRCGSWQ